MSKALNFAKRNLKEIIRDPLSIIFAVMLPLILLFVFKQFNIPNDAYKLENFTPGIVEFSFSFITLFTAMLVSKDRFSSFLIRLGISPMVSAQYVIGYILAIIPLIFIQNILFYSLAAALGLTITWWVVISALISVIIAIFFVAVGILIGSLFSEKASSGISSIIIQLVCFTSGMYFPKELLGDTYAAVCEYLPFWPALNIMRETMHGNISAITANNIIVFSVYLAASILSATLVFRKKQLNNK